MIFLYCRGPLGAKELGEAFMLEAINEQVTTLLCVDNETAHWKRPGLVYDLVKSAETKASWRPGYWGHSESD